MTEFNTISLIKRLESDGPEVVQRKLDIGVYQQWKVPIIRGWLASKRFEAADSGYETMDFESYGAQGEAISNENIPEIEPEPDPEPEQPQTPVNVDQGMTAGSAEVVGASVDPDAKAAMDDFVEDEPKAE